MVEYFWSFGTKNMPKWEEILEAESKINVLHNKIPSLVRFKQKLLPGSLNVTVVRPYLGGPLISKTQ